MSTFEHAVEIARKHIPITQRVVAEEFWCGYTIVQMDQGEYRVYDADAWEEPEEMPMLPWHAPLGTIVAHVDMEGRVQVAL